jgi:NAD+ diphosphatase
MIQDIHPHSFSNRYVETDDIGENDYVFHFKENSLLLKVYQDEYDVPRRKDFTRFPENPESIFLFSLNETNCFLIWDHVETDSDQLKYVYHEISFFRTLKQKQISWVAIVAQHLMNWYSLNKFCGKCGAKTIAKKDERAITCTNCNTTIYPKISPAIIVAIVCNDKLLLAHNANFQNNWYSLVAGYADVGESLEDAVKREVKEEVGLDVNNIRYYKSQPWPFSGSMMIGFIAEADEKQPICIDNKEITGAQWYNRGHLPNHPTSFSIAGEMIEKFEKGELNL